LQSEIISVGTELLLGDILDTNSNYLAKELARLGIDVFYLSSVGDNLTRIQDAIRIAASRSDLIILTGGLGPTDDDLTKQALSNVLGLPLYEEAKEVARLNNFFKKRGVKMSLNNLRQALIPQGAIILENAIGTASGIIVNKDEKYFILLPGPPSEMKHVFEKQVKPWLKANISTSRDYLHSHTLKFIGISESRLNFEIEDILNNNANPTVALLAKNGEIHCRLTAKVKSQWEFEMLIDPVKKEILERVGQYYYGDDDISLEQIIGKMLTEKNLTLVTAESCTGGMIAQRITSIPGSSEYFLGSIVAYANSVKENILNVPREILSNYGAVSKETALAMAEEVKKVLKSDLGLAITGIAGPGGGTEEKPVGLIYIALVGYNINVCKKYIFTGTRNDIRWRSSTWALNLLRRSIEEL
jgi:nicotinamide-nucleotide amidase